jgi:hypothetical protein
MLGINEALPGTRVPFPDLPDPVTYPVDLDIGEVADGCHLIVESIGLTQSLLFNFKFAPEDASEGLWPSMDYGADVSPPGWNNACMDGEEYERPVPQATCAWFDFYRCDYESFTHSGDETRKTASRGSPLTSRQGRRRSSSSDPQRAGGGRRPS